MATARTEDIYCQLKQMAVSFQLRPGDRLNEMALSRQLNVSRTPLREALNRLVAERLFDFQPGVGFFCRQLDAQSVFDLYELRRIIEVQAVRLACQRAKDEDLIALKEELEQGDRGILGKTVADACTHDETFHVGIAHLSGNAVLVHHLEQLNDSIRFIRWIGMPERLERNKSSHSDIMASLMSRDAASAAGIMEGHITKRMDQVVDSVKEGISSIYMNTSYAVPLRVIGAEL